MHNARYLCSRDALGLKAEQPVGQATSAARDDRVSCIQGIYTLIFPVSAPSVYKIYPIVARVLGMAECAREQRYLSYNGTLCLQSIGRARASEGIIHSKWKIRRRCCPIIDSFKIILIIRKITVVEHARCINSPRLLPIPSA